VAKGRGKHLYVTMMTTHSPGLGLTGMMVVVSSKGSGQTGASSIENFRLPGISFPSESLHQQYAAEHFIFPMSRSVVVSGIPLPISSSSSAIFIILGQMGWSDALYAMLKTVLGLWLVSRS